MGSSFFCSVDKTQQSGSIRIGEFLEHYCLFTDSLILVRDIEDQALLDDTAKEEDDETTLLSDQGPALKLTADHFGWNQVNDRKHITTDIPLYWGGLDNPDKYKDDIHRILDTAFPTELDTLIKEALSEHSKTKARELLQRIADNRKHCCFAYTHHHFTARHVVSQRGEKINGAVKGGGMKLILTKCTFTESFEQIMAGSGS